MTAPPLLAGCAEPLGLKDNTIPSKQITASSFYKTWGLSAFSWYPSYARLDNQGKFNAWTAQTNSASEWLQVGQAPSGVQGWGRLALGGFGWGCWIYDPGPTQASVPQEGVSAWPCLCSALLLLPLISPPFS